MLKPATVAVVSPEIAAVDNAWKLILVNAFSWVDVRPKPCVDVSVAKSEALNALNSMLVNEASCEVVNVEKFDTDNE